MTELAQLLNLHGYVVLTPDSRGHGGSGGDRITFGLLERNDVALWLDWLEARFHPPAFYGYGASLGGVILIHSLEVAGDRFRAIIAECPFADLRAVAYDRLSAESSVPRFLLAPVIELAFAYARARYGLNLYAANPEAALNRSHTPTLLIHGTSDRNIPIEHSRRLLAGTPRTTELWEVPGGGHVGAWSASGPEYEQRVIDWYATH